MVLHRGRKYSAFIRGISEALWKDTFLHDLPCLLTFSHALQDKAKLLRIAYELSPDLNSTYFSMFFSYCPDHHSYLHQRSNTTFIQALKRHVFHEELLLYSSPEDREETGRQVPCSSGIYTLMKEDS